MTYWQAMERGKHSAAESLKRQLIVIGALRGVILWYAIEKLFETRIGLNAQQIVLVGVLAQGSKVIFELPTSVVADRWSRRKLLLLAQVAMVTCSIIMGFSNGLLTYCIGTLIWSLSDALSSGVYEAFAYDSIEAGGLGKSVRKIYARMHSAQYFSMALAGVAAGVVSIFFSLRWSYFITVVPALLVAMLMLRLPEVSRRSVVAGSSWTGHIGEALKTLWAPKLRWAALLYICLSGLLSIWYEYYQLLGVDVRLSSFWFSILITVLTLGMVAGAEIAHHRQGTAGTLGVVWATILIAHLVGLRFHTAATVFLSLFVVFVALMLLQMYLELYIQSVISSERRATIFSVMTTVSYAWFFVLAAVFSVALRWLGIRGALTLAATPLLLLGVIDLMRRTPWVPNKESPDIVGEELPER